MKNIFETVVFSLGILLLLISYFYMELSEPLFGILAFAIFLTAFLIIPALRKQIYKNDLHEKIAWISENKSTGLGLKNYILKLDVPEQHRFSHAENNELSKLIEAHRNYVVQQYFRNELKVENTFYKLMTTEYYVFSLYSFLSTNKSIFNFEYGKKVHMDENVRISENKSAYKLTNHGIVYFKLYLATLLFCENNPKLQKLIGTIDPKKEIIHTIETKTVIY